MDYDLIAISVVVSNAEGTASQMTTLKAIGKPAKRGVELETKACSSSM